MNQAFVGGNTIFFGEGSENPELWLDPDSYELPLVAACCGPFDYVDPTTAQKIPYVNNCLYDAVQQICWGMADIVRHQAESSPLGEKLSLLWLASILDKAENRAACFEALWHDGPPGPEGQNVNELLGTQWEIPNLPLDTDAIVRITELTVDDWTEAADKPELTPCNGIFDNDDAIIPTAPFDPPDTVPGDLSLLTQDSSALGSSPWGTQVPFVLRANESTLGLARDTYARTVVTGLHLEGAEHELDHAQLVLAHPLRVTPVGGEHVVPTGEVAFRVVLTFAGQSRFVTMHNAEPLVYRARSSGGWEFDPVELIYDEPGVGVWRLVLDGLDFD